MGAALAVADDSVQSFGVSAGKVADVVAFDRDLDQVVVQSQLGTQLYIEPFLAARADQAVDRGLQVAIS